MLFFGLQNTLPKTGIFTSFAVLGVFAVIIPLFYRYLFSFFLLFNYLIFQHIYFSLDVAIDIDVYWCVYIRVREDKIIITYTIDIICCNIVIVCCAIVIVCCAIVIVCCAIVIVCCAIVIVRSVC
jgi:hypothetical protein